MKEHRNNDKSSHERFLSSCCSSGRAIGTDETVCTTTAKSDRDPSKRKGMDLLVICCSARCAQDMTVAFQGEIDVGTQLGSG